jgi:hypothetical protein
VPRRARTGITATRVLEALARVGFASPKELAEWKKRGIATKLADKVSALSTLARRFGIFKDTVHVTGKDGEPLFQLDFVRPAP